MELNSTIILAISIFMGIWIYCKFVYKNISHRDMVSAGTVTIIIIINYWVLTSSGLLFGTTSDDMSPSSIPGEDIMEEYIDVGKNFTDACVNNYLYRGYTEDSAKQLCKIKERNIRGRVR